MRQLGLVPGGLVRLHPHCHGDVFIDTNGGEPFYAGTDYDSVLSVYTGSCGALTEITCNDDIDAVNQRSRVSLAGHPGETFYIRVSGFNGFSGGGHLYGQCTPRQCVCDWDFSGLLNSQGFFNFLEDFFSGTADFNTNGQINSQDFFDFIGCFFGGR